MPTDGAKSGFQQSATHGRSVYVNAATLRYAAAGTTGSPVLLVYGFPRDMAGLPQAHPLLAASHQVLAVDLRGFGDLDTTPGDYDSKACLPRPSAGTCGLAPQRGGGKQAEGPGSGDDLGPGVRAELRADPAASRWSRSAG